MKNKERCCICVVIIVMVLTVLVMTNGVERIDYDESEELSIEDVSKVIGTTMRDNSKALYYLDRNLNLIKIEKIKGKRYSKSIIYKNVDKIYFTDIKICSKNTFLGILEGENKTRYYLHKKGVLKEITNIINEHNNKYVGSICEGCRIAIFYSDGLVKIYNIDNESKVEDFKLDGIKGAVSRIEDRGTTFLLYQEGLVNIYRKSENRYIYMKELKMDNIKNLKSSSEKYPLVISSNKGMCYQNDEGIFFYDLDKNNEFKIMDTINYSINDYRGLLVEVLLNDSKGDIECLYLDRFGVLKIYKYHKSHKLSNRIKVIKVFGIHNSEMLRMKLSDLMFDNEGIKIQYDILDSTENIYKEIGEKLRTKDIDIVVMDGMNKKYFDESNLLKKIDKKYIKNSINGIYKYAIEKSNVFPISFNVITKVSAHGVGNIGFFNELSNNEDGLYNRWFFYSILNVAYSDFFKEKDMNKLNKNDILNYYKYIKKIYSKSKNDWSTKGMYKTGDFDDYESNSITNSLINAIPNDVKICYGEIFNVQDLNILKSFCNEKHSFYTFGKEKPIIKPTYELGVISKSKESMKVIEYFSDCETQSDIMNEFGLFPSKLNSLKEMNKTQYSMPNSKVGETDMYNEMKVITLKGIGDRDSKEFLSEVNKDSYIIREDLIVKQIINREIDKVINEKNLDELAKKRYSTYKMHIERFK